MKDRIYEPNPKVVKFLAGRFPAFSGIALRKSSNCDQKWLLPHHKAKYHLLNIRYIFLCTSQATKIGPQLRDGTGLLWIFLTVKMVEYFRGPRNSSTTAVHYGKCEWVFKWQGRL